MRDVLGLKTDAFNCLLTADLDFLSAKTPLLEANEGDSSHSSVERMLRVYEEVAPLLRLSQARGQIIAGKSASAVRLELGSVRVAFQAYEDCLNEARLAAPDSLQLLLGEALLRVYSARNLVELAMKILELVDDPLRV